MKELYVNPGEDDSLDAALDAKNALENEFIGPDFTSEDDEVDDDEDEESEEDEDTHEEEGELPEYYDDDADDHEFPDDD